MQIKRTRNPITRDLTINRIIVNPHIPGARQIKEKYVMRKGEYAEIELNQRYKFPGLEMPIVSLRSAAAKLGLSIGFK
ncbi:MAG: hypothetical protein AB1467_03830 [Candidatus Diapherotrites archaeon]